METVQAIKDRSAEISMIINIGKALGGQWDCVSDRIRAINDACMEHHTIHRVIFETDYLEDEHIIELCEICSQHQVAFVKTSSGYGFVKQVNGHYSCGRGTDHHLSLTRAHCAPGVHIKAAGGVAALDDLLHVPALGVTRVGGAATDTILKEAKMRGYQ